MKKAVIHCFLVMAAVLIFQLAPVSGHAQTNYDDLSPKTQQYIENLNEVKEAQNDGKPAGNSSASEGTSIWKYMFYGALSGAAYAFWLWVKRLKN